MLNQFQTTEPPTLDHMTRIEPSMLKVEYIKEFAEFDDIDLALNEYLVTKPRPDFLRYPEMCMDKDMFAWNFERWAKEIGVSWQQPEKTEVDGIMKNENYVNVGD